MKHGGLIFNRHKWVKQGVYGLTRRCSTCGMEQFDVGLHDGPEWENIDEGFFERHPEIFVKKEAKQP